MFRAKNHPRRRALRTIAMDSFVAPVVRCIYRNRFNLKDFAVHCAMLGLIAFLLYVAGLKVHHSPYWSITLAFLTGCLAVKFLLTKEI